jgi:hypothetical protein
VAQDGAIVDCKIEVVEQVAKYIKPDFFTNYDDFATERNLFMSTDSFCEIAKPHLKRYYDAVKAFDMIPIQHTCGYATTSSRTSSTWGLSAGRRCSRPTTSWPCRNSSATSAIARLDVIVYVATIDLGCWDDCAHMAFRSICRD